jgi:hypothetical protein
MAFTKEIVRIQSLQSVIMISDCFTLPHIKRVRELWFIVRLDQAKGYPKYNEKRTEIINQIYRDMEYIIKYISDLGVIPDVHLIL